MKRILYAAAFVLAFLFAVQWWSGGEVYAAQYGGFQYEERWGYIEITGYSGSGGSVTIPASINGKPVRVIGNTAFEDKYLTSVTIPNSVTTIGGFAFWRNFLTSVTIPNSVTSIGSGAFARNKLTSVTIPNSVTTIGDEAFAINSLTSVTLGNSVTTIGNNAFRGNQLTSVTIPNSVTTIGDYAFVENQLTSVTLGSSVTTIGNNAFQGNQLTSVTLGSSVTTIGNNAFQGNQLTSVTLGSSVTTIGNNAFQGNQLTSVTIPSSVRSIGCLAFANNRISSITFPDQINFSYCNTAFQNNPIEQLGPVLALSSAEKAKLAAEQALNAVNDIKNTTLNFDAQLKAIKDQMGNFLTLSQAQAYFNNLESAFDQKINNLNQQIQNIQQVVNSKLPPVLNNVSGLNGANATSSGSLQVVIDASNASVYRYRIDNGSWSAWRSYAETVSIPIPRGVHTLTIQVANLDEKGNPGPTAQKSMQVIGL